MVQENGAGMATEILTPGQMTVLPRGSIHTMINNGEYPFAFFGGCRRDSCVNREYEDTLTYWKDVPTVNLSPP